MVVANMIKNHVYGPKVSPSEIQEAFQACQREIELTLEERSDIKEGQRSQSLNWYLQG